LKTVIPVLLSVLLFNSLFYHGYFSIAIIHAKIEAHQNLAQNNDNNSAGIIKVPVNKLDKDEFDEVWFKGNLYDVSGRQIINDTAYVFLINDNLEQQLLADNFNYFRDDTDIFCACNFKIPHSKKIISLQDCLYIYQVLPEINHHHLFERFTEARNNYCLNNPTTGVPGPPPKS
jgi:hypothetical protein